MNPFEIFGIFILGSLFNVLVIYVLTSQLIKQFATQIKGLVLTGGAVAERVIGGINGK